MTWAVLRDAIHRDIDARIGLEDTLFEPDGQRTEDNASLMHAAVKPREERRIVKRPLAT